MKTRQKVWYRSKTVIVFGLSIIVQFATALLAPEVMTPEVTQKLVWIQAFAGILLRSITDSGVVLLRRGERGRFQQFEGDPLEGDTQP